MGKGLFASIYGTTGEGIFDDLYSHKGASPPVQSEDIRLGGYETGLSGAGNFFSQDIGGFPLWLVGIGFLGFAWAYRRKKKKHSLRRK